MCVRTLAVVAQFALLAQATAQPVLWEENGNHYEFVAAEGVNWVVARDAAAGMSFLGVDGHLATITSQAENDFILATFGTGVDDQFTWIGGHEPADDGNWFWAVGPEAGLQFSIHAAPTPPFNYANWGGVEPNDFAVTEDYAMMNVGSNDFAGIAQGKWADASETPTPTEPIVGYIVEYSGDAAPICCLGNATKDSPGEVNFGDVTAVLGNWLVEDESGNALGDANCDGVVNFGDVTTVLGNWLAQCP